eukprot:2533177-Alexandrium_andersonii.AAC.1
MASASTSCKCSSHQSREGASAGTRRAPTCGPARPGTAWGSGRSEDAGGATERAPAAASCSRPRTRRPALCRGLCWIAG